MNVNEIGSTDKSFASCEVTGTKSSWLFESQRYSKKRYHKKTRLFLSIGEASHCLCSAHLRGKASSICLAIRLFPPDVILLLAFRSLTWRYNLVHVHNMPDVLVFEAFIPRVCGARVILDLHDPMPELMIKYLESPSSFHIESDLTRPLC
jgi:hypothetical protein